MMVTVMMSAMTNVLAFSDITITLGFKKKSSIFFFSFLWFYSVNCGTKRYHYSPQSYVCQHVKGFLSLNIREVSYGLGN